MVHPLLLDSLNRDVLGLIYLELDVVSLCRWARTNRKFYCLISETKIYQQCQLVCRHRPKSNWLTLCFRENYFDLARCLVRANPQQLESKQTTEELMELGCLNGRTEMVKWLIGLTSKEQYQSKVNYNFNLATSWSRFDLCQYLASQFAIRDDTLRSALFISCSQGHVAFCQVLYDLRKETTDKLTLDRQVFSYSCNSGKINMVRWALTLVNPATLYSSPEKATLLQEAVEDGYLDIARILHELFPEMVLLDFHQALVVNCGIGNLWMLRWLLEIYEPAGKTTYFTAMFQAAIIRGRNNILAYLWEPGRLPETKLVEIFTSACYGANLSTTQWLWENTLNQGQDITSIDWLVLKSACRKETKAWLDSIEK